MAYAFVTGILVAAGSVYYFGMKVSRLNDKSGIGFRYKRNCVSVTAISAFQAVVFQQIK